MVGASEEPTARVFVSYRRADGPYAVGWIHERLAHLEDDRLVAEVRTVFSDSDLGYGENFPDRLDREVEECAVLIVLIGPNWRGERDGGPARILEDDDWVGREIVTALERNATLEPDEKKLIIPALISGAEMPAASELRDDQREFADMNALVFDDPSGLKKLEAQVREFLAARQHVRAARAELAGGPIKAPDGRQPWHVWLTAAVAGVVGAAVGWLFVALDNKGTVRVEFEKDLGISFEFLVGISTFQTGLWAALCVIGVGYYRTMLAPLTKIRWLPIAMTGAVAAVVAGWAIVALGVGSPLAGGGFRTWSQAMLAIALMSPWIVMIVGPGWMEPRSDLLGGRVKAVAAERRALAVSIPVAILAAIPSIWVTGALAEISGNRLTNVALGLFLSLMTAGVLEYSHGNLRSTSKDLVKQLENEFGGRYRQNATPVLVDDPRDLWAGLMWWAPVPTLVALIQVALQSV